VRDFIDLWAGLPPLLRFGTAGLILIGATGLWFVAFVKMAMFGWCLGGILLVFSFPNDAEKRGYHDF
jgi:hypothetical protein